MEGSHTLFMNDRNENEMDMLELSFRNSRPKKGCPECGEAKIVDHPDGRRTYACGYSRGGVKGDTPCKTDNEMKWILRYA